MSLQSLFVFGAAVLFISSLLPALTGERGCRHFLEGYYYLGVMGNPERPSGIGCNPLGGGPARDYDTGGDCGDGGEERKAVHSSIEGEVITRVSIS